jgi:hypothetical protein
MVKNYLVKVHVSDSEVPSSVTVLDWQLESACFFVILVNFFTSPPVASVQVQVQFFLQDAKDSATTANDNRVNFFIFFKFN